jgi:hypothetical protein
MRKNVLTFIMVIGVLFLVGSQAQAVVKYLIVPVESFTAAYEGDGYSRMAAISMGSGVTVGYIWKTGDDGFLQAGFNLPDGVNVKGVTMTYYDNDATDNVTCYVYRTNIWNGTRQVMFSCASSGAATFIRNVGDYSVNTAGSRNVKTATFDYSIVLYFPDADTSSFWPTKYIYGIRIMYDE